MIPTTEQLALYRSIFRGRDDCYARYWEKNGRSGYSPAYSLEMGTGTIFLGKAWSSFFWHTLEESTILQIRHRFQDFIVPIPFYMQITPGNKVG